LNISLPFLQRWFAARMPRGETMQLHHHQVYILPSRYGWLLGAAVLALLAGSINYSLSLGYALTFWLVSLGLLSMLYTWRNLAGLQLSVGPCPSVFAGQEATLAFLAGNARYPRAAVEFSIEGFPARCSDIGETENTRVDLRLPTTRRGWLRPGRLRLSTRYPLGLFTAWSWLAPDCRCLVYPAPEDDAPPLPMGEGDETGGRTPAEGQEDFQGLRPWRPGDSPRRIAWKAWARGQENLSKVFSDARSSAIHLDWNRTGTAGPESRLSRLTRWVLDAEAAGLAYGLSLPGTEIQPGLGESHREACLRALALWGLQ
jgi:uncharacterized protein (DUF58 family)